VLQDPGGQGFSGPSFNAINDAGQSVGGSATASGGEAVFWSRKGKATVLQDVGGQSNSSGVAINAFGWSVGTSGTSSGLEAVLWSPTGKATDHGTVLGPAWGDTQALGINDLVGTGAFKGGTRGVLLTPDFQARLFAASALPSIAAVPEPSTWAMMLLGLAGLGFVGLRSRNSKPF
jgi:PEP-CTERM motif